MCVMALAESGGKDNDSMWGTVQNSAKEYRVQFKNYALGQI